MVTKEELDLEYKINIKLNETNIWKDKVCVKLLEKNGDIIIVTDYISKEDLNVIINEIISFFDLSKKNLNFVISEKDFRIEIKFYIVEEKEC